MKTTKQIKLGISVRGVGYYAGAWRDPDVPSDGGMSVEFYAQLARIAERGLFDMVFFADHVGESISDVPKGSLGRSNSGADLEPFTLAAALGQVTRNIGFVVTASTTFWHPYHLARLTLSLDHLTGGRTGWNVVTSSQDHEALNFDGEKILGKGARYERAQEAVDVVMGLWDTWDEDAFVRDKASGQFFDPEKMHVLNHKGNHFQVRGPLNLPRSPQGRPIIIQAGSSTSGIDLASRVGDVIYTAQNSIDDALTFVDKVKDGLTQHGRTADSAAIMPGILPVIGSTRAEAQEKYDRMRSEMDPLAGLAHLSLYFGDLSGLPLDEPVPADLKPLFAIQSRGEEMLKLARRNNWTLRQMYQSVMIGNAHRVVVGTAEDVADQMEAWFTAGAADGFNIVPAKSPSSLLEFVDFVVPQLQRRGLYRTSYESSTLRGNLGLPMPRKLSGAAS